MSLLKRLVGRGNLRELKRTLASVKTPSAYVALAQEHARLGELAEAIRVCEEGLEQFPGSTELSRLCQRARKHKIEERVSELKSELSDAPRPALWRELCECLLQSRQLERCEGYATTWAQSDTDVDALLMLARVRLERFYEDRGRECGLRTLESLDRAREEHPRDARTWKLRKDFFAAIGAWDHAAESAGRLLELWPGDPEIEAQYRSFRAQPVEETKVDAHLRRVERTGELETGSSADQGDRVGERDLRPRLQELVGEPGVRATVYVRGGTALVQGPKGATAERLARSVRTVVQSGRQTSRRLGLGRVLGVELEGDFGVLAMSAGELDAGAIWSAGELSSSLERSLCDLAGIDAEVAA